MAEDHLAKVWTHSLRAVWALVCRVSGTGNLDEVLEPSEIEGDEDGWLLVEWDGKVTDDDFELEY